MELHLLGAQLERVAPAAARRCWRDYRVTNGWAPDAPLVAPPGSNLKVDKSSLPTWSLSLAPATSGGHNVCGNSSPDCRRGCVAHNGNGRYDSVTAARALRVQFLYDHPSEFLALVGAELDRAVERFGRIACRLNTFSDLPYEVLAPWLVGERPAVEFYDYTKLWARRSRPNYHLTYSASELTADAAIVERVGSGANVAVVFDVRRGRPLPTTLLGCRVVDGDASDARYRDPSGVVVGLRAKGRMAGAAMARRVG
jgi:hypothetical protein